MNLKNEPVPDIGNPDSRLAILCKLGGISAILAASLAVLQVTIEVIGVGFLQIPVPQDVVGWLTLLQKNRLLGLTELTMLQIPAFALSIPLFLALHGILRQRKSAMIDMASAFAFIGITIYLSSNTAFSMLHISTQYAAATSELQRSMIVSAGQAILAIYEGIGIDVGLFLFMIAVLVVSVSFHSLPSGNGIVWIGILSALLTFAFYIVSTFTPLAIFVLEAAGAFLAVWFFLIGRRLLQFHKQFASEPPG